MNNYGFRGFLIAISVFFLLTIRGCSKALAGTFSLTILYMVVGGIIGAVGFLIGKQFKTEKQLNEKAFIAKNKKLLFISLCLVLVLLYLFGRHNAILNSDKVEDSLRNNLSNLNGEWWYKNDKDDETWWLQICYTPDSKNGTYVLSHKYDSWGKKRIKKVRLLVKGNLH